MFEVGGELVAGFGVPEFGRAVSTPGQNFASIFGESGPFDPVFMFEVGGELVAAFDMPEFSAAVTTPGENFAFIF